MLKKIICLIFVFSLFSCKSKKENEDMMIPAYESYKKGMELFQEGHYKDASDHFGKIYFQHPGGDLTPYAELMEAFSLYSARQYQESVDVLDNFILIHPTHEDIAYAYYLKGLDYYMQISDIHHDQALTQRAKDAFEELISRFPGTKYALDASIKIDLVNDHLAGKEMEIGRYYQNRSNPAGAINRFQSIIDNYQTTTHTPEALYRMVESFIILGLKDEANKYAAVLEHNYPDSNWYKYAKTILALNSNSKKK